MKKILILLLFPILCNAQDNFFWSYNSGGGYGYLYNWYAATDARGIAASGWGVPTQAQFQTLQAYLGGESVAGGHMKETGTIHWTSQSAGCDNSSKFNARGNGLRDGSSGLFSGIKTSLYFNCATEYNSTLAYCGPLAHNTDVFGSLTGYVTDKKRGNSIRLLKTTTTLSDGQSGTYTGNDGTVYPTICIGTQEWLARNLYETKYANGDLIPVVTDNSAWAALTTGARCVYNNEEKYK